MKEEEKKAIDWLKKEITKNKVHIQDCKNAVDDKFYYDLDDEIKLTQEDLDAEETLLNLIETQTKIVSLMAEQLTSPINGKEWVIEYYSRLAEEGK